MKEEFGYKYSGDVMTEVNKHHDLVAFILQELDATITKRSLRQEKETPIETLVVSYKGQVVTIEVSKDGIKQV